MPLGDYSQVMGANSSFFRKVLHDLVVSNSEIVESLKYFGYSSVYFVFCSDINN